MLFNFATQFRNTHSKIAPPAKFELTEDDFSGFISFLDSVGFEYESQTSILLKELKESAKTENYYTASQSLFDSLEVAIERKGFAEFDLYKEEIAKLIEEEIVGRYYLQKGKAEYSLNKDEVIEKCIEVLTNPNLSTQVLSGNNKKVTHSLKSQTTRVKGTESKYVDKLTAQKGIKRMPS
jgi:carboxyl-terminal processing protease